MSKSTLVEMLRSYAEGEEETMGGQNRLDAADRIDELDLAYQQSELYTETIRKQLVDALNTNVELEAYNTSLLEKLNKVIE
jgi:hypothetical protein|tara:strand:+ start:6143 stop:6385 length:243 start_codon:yes stop_codon:yes gene_type:complete